MEEVTANEFDSGWSVGVQLHHLNSLPHLPVRVEDSTVSPRSPGLSRVRDKHYHDRDVVEAPHGVDGVVCERVGHRTEAFYDQL